MGILSVLVSYFNRSEEEKRLDDLWMLQLEVQLEREIAEILIGYVQANINKTRRG